jgi:hypothetical protein
MHSYFRLFGLFVVFWLTSLAHAADNVILITLDGLRWQEVFHGLDRRLTEHEDYSEQSALLQEKFWLGSAEQNAEALFPFLHGKVFHEGSYVGNRSKNSCAAVSNPWYFSYPGYSEILTGRVNPEIASNGKIPNPEKTFLELLENSQEFKGRTAAFASWDVFQYIFNTQRSGIHVNAFAALAEPANQQERFLNRLYADIPPPWPTVRNDAFTHHYALSYLKRERPRVLYISYGESDDFAHDGKYDEYVLAAHRADRFIEEIWTTVQNMSEYRDSTVLFITTDHGRGEEPIETWQHHASKRSLSGPMTSLAQYKEGILGSDAVWMAAMGPGIATSGLLDTGTGCASSDQIAATLLSVLGEDAAGYTARMGQAIDAFLE